MSSLFGSGLCMNGWPAAVMIAWCHGPCLVACGGMAGGRTALMVVVAEAEPTVARLRLQLDPFARLGVPAHVTVLFPFIPASGVRDDVIVRLAALFRTVP